MDNFRCPNCERGLYTSIEYVAGQPVVKNICRHCGYDSSKIKTTIVCNEADFEMDEICKSYANEYPNVECINCGEKHYHFVAKDYPKTNYDKIRNMSVDEMAEIIYDNVTRNVCDLICNGKCNAVKTLDKSSDEVCKEIIRNWLNAEVRK